jgi:hypothetical protein
MRKKILTWLQMLKIVCNESSQIIPTDFMQCRSS